MSIYFNHAFSLIESSWPIFEKTSHNIFESFHVNRNWVLPNYDTCIVFLILNLLVPDVVLYILYCEPFLRICIEDAFNEISAVITDKIRDCVICIENFFVEYICLGVFERQIATDHGVENHTTAPNVSW